MLQQNEVQSQYLFGDEYQLLEPEKLLKVFSLSGQDAMASFQLAMGEMYQIDIQEQEKQFLSIKEHQGMRGNILQSYPLREKLHSVQL